MHNSRKPLITPPRWLAFFALLCLALVAFAHASAHNYVDTAGPRFAGGPSSPSPPAPRGDTLVVATFNIRNGREVQRAIRVILENEELATADLILLQEVDAEAADVIADTLGMAWVYYPSRERWGQGFGNAVLSRWPMVDDAKLILPHRSLFNGSRRTAVMAVVEIRGLPVRVYSTHLATPVNQSPGDRRDQLRTVLEDASADDLVVVGGDFNSGSIPALALESGYLWPTREGPRTTWFIRADHLLFKGFGQVTVGAETGTIRENRGASDHLPVWAAALLPAETPEEVKRGGGD